MTADTWYKVLGPDAQSIHGGNGTWHTPKGKQPGKWMPAIKNPACCSRGYHLVRLDRLPEWLRDGCAIFEAEGRGDSHASDDKTSFAQARLLRRVYLSDRDLRLFAADCAEHVLPIFLKVRPQDGRPAKAIEAARAFARGEIDDAARAAARAAAGDAAWPAARVAAGVAAWAAARAAARDAAWDAARAAARAAAGDAAWDAARDAERRWQAGRLASYLTGEAP